jgi:two-component system OmpR family sensor kinase
MRIGRLTLKIYLYSVVAVLAAAGVVVASAFTLQSEHRQHMNLLSEPLVRSVWLDHQDTEANEGTTTHARESPGALVTLYDIGGRLVASTATQPLPMPSQSQLAELREKGFVELSHTMTAHQVRNEGRVVAIGIVKLRHTHSLWTLAQPVLILLLILLAVAVIFARHLARPLQHVANVAKAFGHGDLNARVGNQRNDEIGEVARAFDAMADRVAGLMAAQQELMANVSHELLTPLSRIQVAVDLITDGKSQQVSELVPDIAQDVAEVERLIDDVMTVAKLDLSRSSGTASVVPLRLEAVAVSTLIEEAVTRFCSQHPTRELAIEVDPGLPELSADSVLLRRVVDNLLENARKFSDHDTKIRLSARATKAGVTIAIADEGIGIEEADIEKVFTPFFRSDKSRSRATGGMGLGLALARRVVEAHEGTIEITSRPGRGTTVTLALPAQPVNSKHVAVTVEESAGFPPTS